MDNMSVPLYQKMMFQIIHDIYAGNLKENDKLPSEQQLGEIFGISRITVRKALDELQYRKFIYKKKGQGSFVLSRKVRNKSYRYLDVEAKIKEMNLSPHTRIDSFNIIADRRAMDIKQKMGLDSNEYLYEIEKTFLGDKKRILYTHMFISFPRFPGIQIDELENENILPILYGQFDLNPDDIKVDSEASLVTKEDQKHVDADIHDPKVVRKISVIEDSKLVLLGSSEIVGFLPMYFQP